MLFNSIQFLIFFPIVAVLYFSLPHKYRWFMLLLASCIFYMAFIPVYIFVLATTIIIDYLAGIYIEKSLGWKRKMLLIVSIFSTCLVLFIFKYFNFFNANLANIANFLHWNYSLKALKLILPIGLSFHTFQSLSYVIEVYKKRQKAEHNFGIYALYVMFFPQLVAGPIERPYNLIHQFYEKHIFEYKRITDGLKLMAWGMFKKAVVADRLAVLVNHVYGAPSDHQGTGLIIATLFFSFQIFCDFSGYSDIAIGSAQVMGFRLMNNFNRPYYAKSISEFWRRWHISLSTWFRDYVYIPLGGKYVSKARLYFNLFITFLISGLWHGASWTFVIWGALNGFYMILESMTSGLRKNIVEKTKINNFPTFHKILRVGTTFSLVCFGWIFFRAENLPSAIYIITHLFSGFTNILNLGLNKQDLFIAFMLILIMELIHLVQRKGGLRQMISEKPIWIRWALYLALILAILFLRAPEQTQFIYFQF